MSEQRSMLDRLVGMCVSLLIAAVAVYAAVRLIQAVWTALLVILGIAAVVAAATTIFRNRDRGW